MPQDAKQPAVQTGSVFRLYLAVDPRVTALSGFPRAFEAALWRGMASPEGQAENGSRGATREPAIRCVPLTDQPAIREAEQTLAHQTNARLVVIYQNPASFVAAGAAENETISTLGTWREETQRLLETFRRHRRQILLVNGNAALAAQSALVGQIAQQLGCELDRSLLAGHSDTPPVDGIALALADFTIRHDDVGSRLIAELEASSLPLPPPYSDTKANVLDAWRQSGEAEDQKAKLQELERESDLLLVQLHQVQEELEHYYFVNKDLEEKLQQAQTLSTQREEALHQAQTLAIQREEALTRTQAELARKRKALAAKRKELERKKRQVQDIYRSTSWKLAGPLRKLRRLFSRRARG